MDVYYGFWDRNDRVRYKAPTAKSVKPPSLPPAAITPREIAAKAAKVGAEEGRRLRKRTGRRATRVARPELAFVPAPIAQAGLKTVLG